MGGGGGGGGRSSSAAAAAAGAGAGGAEAEAEEGDLSRESAGMFMTSAIRIEIIEPLRGKP